MVREKTSSRAKPSAGSVIGLIVRRELGAYFGTWSGWVIASLLLFVDGILFQIYGVGTSARFSSDVLTQYLYAVTIPTIAASILASLRLIAEERKAGTLPLLLSSSLTEGQIVLAKYLSALAFIGIITIASVYIPALVFVRGKISIGHIAAGYLGLLLLGSCSVSIGTFASSLVRSQFVAAVIAGVIAGLLVIIWMLARQIDGPLGDLVGQLALIDKHFRPFMQGTVSLAHIVFYVSVTWVFLVLSRMGLESRRWST